MYFLSSFFRNSWQGASYLLKLYIAIYQIDVIGAPFKMKAPRRKMIIIAVSFPTFVQTALPRLCSMSTLSILCRTHIYVHTDLWEYMYECISWELRMVVVIRNHAVVQLQS